MAPESNESKENKEFTRWFEQWVTRIQSNSTYPPRPPQQSRSQEEEPPPGDPPNRARAA